MGQVKLLSFLEDVGWEKSKLGGNCLLTSQDFLSLVYNLVGTYKFQSFHGIFVTECTEKYY